MLDMRRTKRDEKPYVRLGYVAERGNFAGVARAHLENEELLVCRTVQDRHRQPDMVVVVALGAIAMKESLQELLRSRLARRPGNSTDLRLEAPAVFAGLGLKRLKPLYDLRSAGGKRGRNEVAAVDSLSLEGDKAHAWLYLS